MDTRKIGKLIAKRRKELQMTQQALADKLSITNKAVSKWETGQGVPDISLLKALAAILEMSVDELLDGEEDEINFDGKDTSNESFITKNDYFQYLKEEQFYHRKKRCVLFFIGFFCLFLGIACKEVQRYLGRHLDIAGMIMILVGIAIMGYYILFKYVKKAMFKEKKITYLVNKEGILYQEMGKETMFYYNQLTLMFVLENYIVLTINKQLIWIDKKYLEVLKNKSVHLKEYTSSSYQKRQWSCFIGLSVILMICLCLMFGYQVVLRRVGFEMIFDSLNLILWVSIILCIVYMIVIWVYHLDIITILLMIIIALVCLGGSWVLGNTLSSYQTIYSFSPDFSHQLVFKQDKENGQLIYYHYTYLCFAKSSNQMVSDVSCPITTKWITNDCNLITYRNQKQKEVFVATYGDRGNGISYYNVVGSLQGNWIKKNNNDLNYKMNVDDKGITIKHDGQIDTFLYDDIKQNGTISITLYDSFKKPRYVVVMNENCLLNQDYLLKNDGSIQLIDLNQNNVSIELFCTTYKEDVQVQQQIDNQMEESAKKLIKKMQLTLKEDRTLSRYVSTYDMFKVETTSQDFFEVVRLAYRNDIGDDFGIVNYIVTDQITQISVKAGTIDDFFVEVKADTILKKKNTGKISKNGYIPSYRIMKGEGCYLVGKITYRVPGDIGLSPLIHSIEKDVSKDKKYCFVRES